MSRPQPFPALTSPRLRLQVSPTAQTILRSGHPWLFADSLRHQNRPGVAGELAAVYDRHDRFLAIGLFDPDSPIRLRVLHTGKPCPIDSAFWHQRLTDALRRRQDLFDHQTTGFRLLNGESDGWPGLVLDRYDQTLVLKLYTLAWLPHLALLLDLLRPQLGPDRIVLRLSRNLQEAARLQFNKADGDVLFGPPVSAPVVFRETGLLFQADTLQGQKTGFFLDQRENRRRVETLAAGRNVLNAFSFSGGFSLYAARGGAASVTDLDISSHALRSAQNNFALNQSLPAVASCRHECISADAFIWLAENPARQFDLVILDPPSLAKRETDRPGALRAYGTLIASGIRHLARDGVLVACSCSAHVSAPEFFQTTRSTAAKSARRFQELQTSTHPPDHPATFKEANYLKGIFLQFH